MAHFSLGPTTNYLGTDSTETKLAPGKPRHESWLVSRGPAVWWRPSGGEGAGTANTPNFRLQTCKR